MQLHKIQTHLREYRAWLTRPVAEERLYYWESQRIWQENFDQESRNLAEVYDRSLENSRTRRLWSRTAYAPKVMMLEFLRMEPEFVRPMFQELFNENKDVENRISRFVFYCDELLEHYRERHPKTKEQSHYHDDNYGMVSLYLAFQYPDRYAPYEPDTFLRLLRAVGAANIPPAGDFGRHCKVMRTLYTFLQKDETVMQRHRDRLNPERDYMGESLLLSFDFARYITELPV